MAGGFSGYMGTEYLGENLHTLFVHTYLHKYIPAYTCTRRKFELAGAGPNVNRP